MFENLEGKKIPQLSLRTRENGQWKDVTTAEVFRGKKVVAFGLPGAFTPTCSSSHVPRYDELAAELSKRGVDEIVCISVNDPFVMEEWGKAQGTTNVRYLPDGNGELTKALGMLVDKRNLGFGQRSWRYSMLVEDGVVRKAFVEDEGPGDPFEVSDADSMLAWLAPDAPRPRHVAVLTKPGCPFCARAKEALHAHGVAFLEVPLEDAVRGRALCAIAGEGVKTVPQLFVDGHPVGGSEQIDAWLRGGAEAGRA